MTNWRRLLFWRKCDHSTGARLVANFPRVKLYPTVGRFTGMTVFAPAEYHECFKCGAAWFTFQEDEVETFYG